MEIKKTIIIKFTTFNDTLLILFENKNYKKELIRMKKQVVLLLGLFTIFSAQGVLAESAEVSPEARTEVSIGGGRWQYGLGLTGAFSNYFHSTMNHSSSVTVPNKGTFGSKAAPNHWSAINVGYYTGCSYYWNTW